MSRTTHETKAPASGTRARLLALTLACAAAAAAGCGEAPCDDRPCLDADGLVDLKLKRGGAPVTNEEVELRFENPPGGILSLRTNAEGRVMVPGKYRGLRFQVGTDCTGAGQCKRYYAPSKLEGDFPTVELTGGLNYP